MPETATTGHDLIGDLLTDVPLDQRHVALSTPGRTAMTYGALLAGMADLRRVLAEIGNGRRLTMLSRTPASADGLAIFLGCAGPHCFAPISASAPPRMVQDLYDTVMADGFLTGDRNEARWALETLPGAVVLFSATDADGPHRFEILRAAADAGDGPVQDSALVLATSGSTGRPKVVGLSAANLKAAASAIVANFRLGPADAVFCPMPLYHVHGLISAGLATLASGGTFCSLGTFDPAGAAALIDVGNVTWITMLPALHWRMREDLRGTWSPGSNLRFVRSSSSPLESDRIAVLEDFYGAPLFETYGLTETASLFTSPTLTSPRKPGSVGRAIAGDIRISDHADAVGEIEVRGPSVIRAYISDDDGASFREEWLRTGDVGYLDGDGDLFITGRLKEFLKRNGHKMSLAVTDRMVRGLDPVADALSFSYAHPRMGEDLVTAVTLKDGVTVSERDLRQLLFDLMPGYEVPSQIVILDQLPRSPIGKPSRPMLKKMIMEQQTQAPAATSRQERALCAIWNTELGRQDITPASNLFRMGADMQAYRQVMAAFQDAEGVALNLRGFTRSSTVAEQVLHCL